MIPFLDLNQINKRFEADFKKSFNTFLDSGYYILGNQVEAFENIYTTYCGTKYCVGTANGLDALTLILKGYIELGKLQKEDAVIVASNTYIATILSVKLAGLQPILVEPDEKTFNLDPSLVEKAITPKTKVILPTHLYGQLSDMECLRDLSEKHDLLLISDSAQSHGAKNSSGQVSGSLCHASAHSFYPTKNLGALGDAGAVTTSDKDLAELISKLRNYGFSEKYNAEYKGLNSRLDEIQATFLIEKLKVLDADNQKRRNIAKRYLSEIKNSKVSLPFWDGSNNHVFHLFVVRVENRKEIIAHLKANDIGFNIHYPVPPHQQNALSEFKNNSYSISETIHNEVVSIPCHPLLLEEDVSKIIRVLNTF